MPPDLSQHQIEIERNQSAWQAKPLLQEIYRRFYQRIVDCVDQTIPGCVLEIGAGMGNLKRSLPQAISSDLFPNPWLDLTCDAYFLPFRAGALSHLVLFDVFHHLERPFAFLAEARRVLAPGGRVILFEPYISLLSSVAYGIFHHEPIAWTRAMDLSPEKPVENRYYAAQGNATRLFFRAASPPLPLGWLVIRRSAWSSLTYLLSGGFSKPSLYPRAAFPLLSAMDRVLSVSTGAFGARCLVVLEKRL